MSEDHAHTPPICPTCQQPTVHTAVGDVCLECGTVIAHSQHQGLHQHAQTNTSPALAINPLQNLATEEETAPKDHEIPTPAEAVRFRHRLKARLRRMVVPELPSALSEQELESPLNEPALMQTTTAEDAGIAKQLATTSSIAAEQQASRETEAFALAETIAEQDTVPTQPLEPHTDAQETIAATAPEADTAASDTTPEQLVSSEVTTTTDPPIDEKQPKNKQLLVLVSTVASTLLVLGIGLWIVSANKPTAKPIAAPVSNDSPKASAEALKRDQTRKDDLSTISAALEVYKQQNGTYPAGDDIKVVYPLQYTTPPYIAIINYDPSSTADTKIKYAYQSDGKTFAIAAKLEDPTDKEAQNGYYIVRSK